ncbi:MAG: ComEC/Rec2 family competence protein [Clostridia bacterium]|nr:ComEC/Rec2 family competence protein [Clostridia bacterium]
MDVFRGRPLAFACVSASLFALICFSLDISFRLPLAVAFAAVGFGMFLWLRIRRRLPAVWMAMSLSAVLAAVLLLGSWSFFELQVKPFSASEGETVTAEGVVTERMETSGGYGNFAVNLTELDGNRVNRRVLLSCEYASALRAGEHVRFSATVASFSGEARDEANYRLADGFCGVLVCSDPSDCSVLSRESGSFRAWFSERNAAFSERLVTRVGRENGGLAAALLLGNRSFLAATDALRFRRAGISHLLALSGLHVGILIAAVERLLRLLRVPRVFRAVPVVLFSVGYLMLTGGAPSTARAVLMATVLYLAFLVRRNYDPITAISFALFLILAFRPHAVADLGLWMSFCAAGAIVVFVPAVRKFFERRGQAPRGIRKRLQSFLWGTLLTLSVGLFAFCATLPLSAVFFGEVSVVSVPVTMLLSPLVAVGLVLSALSLTLPFPPLLHLTSRMLGAVRTVAARVADGRGITVLFRDRGTMVLLILMTATFLLFSVIRLRQRGLLVLTLLLAVATVVSAYAAIPPASHGVAVTYSDPGAEEFLLFTRGGKAVAVDLSDGRRNYLRNLSKSLHDETCTELEELILTRYRSSEAYLLNRIFAGVKVRVLRLPTPLTDDETAIAARLSEEAERFGVACVFSDESETVKGLSLRVGRDCVDGETIAFVTAEADGRAALWTEADQIPSESAVLRGAYAEADLLIGGENLTLYGASSAIETKAGAGTCRFYLK